MAYMNQECKARIANNVKAILKKHKLKGSLSVRHHSTLVLNIRSGTIDFITNCNETCSNDYYQVSQGFQPVERNHINVNVYHYNKHFSGKARKCLTELVTAMNDGNWNKSDIETDYFNVGWYIDINIGRWDKPYVLEQ